MKEKIKGMKMKEETHHSMVEITPLRDFVISFNEIYIELKEGVDAKVPLRFIQNLKTEKVIEE